MCTVGHIGKSCKRGVEAKREREGGKKREGRRDEWGGCWWRDVRVVGGRAGGHRKVAKENTGARKKLKRLCRITKHLEQKVTDGKILV